jgi:hypothetical protein
MGVDLMDNARELLDNAREAKRRIIDGQSPMRIPANSADADVVLSELAARVEAVLALHVSEGWNAVAGAHAKVGRCLGCNEPWPCPTVRLLNGEAK